jgi:hypothetical protein
MAALSIGVVDHGIEEGDPAQRRRARPKGRHQVEALVDVDPLLCHAGPERAVVPKTVTGTTAQPAASDTR